MAVMVLLAQTLGRRYDVLRALLLAGMVMVVINPYLLLYDIGFQLSFMATLGLVLVVPHFEASLIENKGVLAVRGFFLATLSTQVAVLPLLLHHIGEVSLIAVVVNVLVLPVVPVAMLLTFLTGVLATFSMPIASLVGYAASFVLGYILVIAKWFAALPFAAVTVSTFPAFGVLVLYAVISFIVFMYKNHSARSERSSVFGWEIVEEVDDVKETEIEPPIFFR